MKVTSRSVPRASQRRLFPAVGGAIVGAVVAFGVATGAGGCLWLSADAPASEGGRDARAFGSEVGIVGYSTEDLLASDDAAYQAARADAALHADAAESDASDASAEIDAAPAVVVAAATSCTDTVHIGDSTSIGLVSPSFLPNADDRLAARYRSVGVVNFIPEISGARSMVETLKNEPNATTVAKTRREAGFKGCWVFALGTNDPANVAGNVGTLSRRIDGMMKQAAGMPVLWGTSKTLVTKGPYQNPNMEGWNKAVKDACSRYPNMRVYDWAAEAKDAYFLADGIHPNSAGCAAKAQGFARALAVAFPAGKPPSANCVVRTRY